MTSRADLVRPLALVPHNVGLSRFISGLAQEYKKVGFDAVLGRDNLTYGACQPDIVHIHWPEEHLSWGPDPRTPEARSAAFLGRLDEYKDAGALIVWQVHNLHPHEVESAALEVATYQGLLDRFLTSIATSGWYVLLTLGKIRLIAISSWVQVGLFAALALVVFPEAGAVGLAWLYLAVVTLWLIALTCCWCATSKDFYSRRLLRLSADRLSPSQLWRCA